MIFRIGGICSSYCPVSKTAHSLAVVILLQAMGLPSCQVYRKVQSFDSGFSVRSRTDINIWSRHACAACLNVSCAAGRQCVVAQVGVNNARRGAAGIYEQQTSTTAPHDCKLLSRTNSQHLRACQEKAHQAIRQLPRSQTPSTDSLKSSTDNPTGGSSP